MAHAIGELDEALAHANRVPPAERGPLWQAFVDRLLDERNELEAAK